MASFHHRVKSGKKGNAVEHVSYITRQGRFGTREDLVFSGHGNMPAWAKHDPVSFWRAGDKHERANGAVYREHEISLPEELTKSQQLELVDEMVNEIAGTKPYQFAVHENTSSLEGRSNTHLHLMFSDRMPDGIERAPEKTFRRFNSKNPELGGCKKESGGRNMLELRLELIEMRRRCAELQNAALEKYGHAARVDHRTLKQQGIEREPERHLGAARIRKMTGTEKQQFVTARR
ncbi:plasmid mobilization protein [Hylemonella gracilis]|uniref:Plasmid mobilization protein n=1 Tax=Hylemonella gracilis TaxID=80880 RepID=A0A4P6UHG9_9BURK|nr:MobA/MobL family protein [Hylemonella gracilis]QBK04492.1 plasmid mobilization protein [Hylemonella gracilis]